jgi:hypothetical protein
VGDAEFSPPTAPGAQPQTSSHTVSHGSLFGRGDDLFDMSDPHSFPPGALPDPEGGWEPPTLDSMALTGGRVNDGHDLPDSGDSSGSLRSSPLHRSPPRSQGAPPFPSQSSPHISASWSGKHQHPEPSPESIGAVAFARGASLFEAAPWPVSPPKPIQPPSTHLPSILDDEGRTTPGIVNNLANLHLVQAASLTTFPGTVFHSPAIPSSTPAVSSEMPFFPPSLQAEATRAMGLPAPLSAGLDDFDFE